MGDDYDREEFPDEPPLEAEPNGPMVNQGGFYMKAPDVDRHAGLKRANKNQYHSSKRPVLGGGKATGTAAAAAVAKQQDQPLLASVAKGREYTMQDACRERLQREEAEREREKAELKKKRAEDNRKWDELKKKRLAKAKQDHQDAREKRLNYYQDKPAAPAPGGGGAGGRGGGVGVSGATSSASQGGRGGPVGELQHILTANGLGAYSAQTLIDRGFCLPVLREARDDAKLVDDILNQFLDVLGRDFQKFKQAIKTNIT
ncbi:unnamed protein product [Vitrella brassicaformis CCMP3155]|uniref:Uncharacterized protein n=1 Tax=Vitrella brassicaformis (strain CCMP3155) TaxID=1169540 RepID=A0A0G4EGQ5_VITBC|nr:unnamed protein product [Vitrella brassicaformis CCMP3155]|eukprot:CEL94680.1 unnamed protein product [Vitrella brassicaformis CCMP3155]